MSNTYEINDKIPLLFIIFNRLDTVKIVFEEIKKYKPDQLLIASHGPRNDLERDMCEKVQEYIIKNINWNCEISTNFLKKNKGIVRGVTSAIDWFFKNVEEGIILEHDCLPNQSFFSFCEDNIRKYKKNKRVMHVSGNCFQNTKIGENDYFFSRIPYIWGWATWRRAWIKYNSEMDNYEHFVKSNKFKNFFKHDRDRVTLRYILDKVYYKKLNTWDYQWIYTLIINDGLAISPNKNLVTNIGFGELAENCKNKNDKLSNFRLENISFPLNHVDLVESSQVGDTSIIRNYFHVSYFKYILIKIKLLEPLLKIKRMVKG